MANSSVIVEVFIVGEVRVVHDGRRPGFHRRPKSTDRLQSCRPYAVQRVARRVRRCAQGRGDRLEAAGPPEVLGHDSGRPSSLVASHPCRLRREASVGERDDEQAAGRQHPTDLAEHGHRPGQVVDGDAAGDRTNSASSNGRTGSRLRSCTTRFVAAGLAASSAAFMPSTRARWGSAEVGHPRRHEVEHPRWWVAAAVDAEMLVQATDRGDGPVVEVRDEPIDGVELGVGGEVGAGQEAGRELGVGSAAPSPERRRRAAVSGQCPPRRGDGRPTRGSAGASARCDRT